MAPGSDLDTQRLAVYLRTHVESFDGTPLVRRIEGGQSNPTYVVEAGRRRYVLRRKPSGTLLPSAHAIEREYQAMRALERAAFPVPCVRALCEDPEVLGSAFYVMDFVEGRILTDQTLPGIDPVQRRAMYGELNRVLAALHGLDWKACGLAGFGAGERYVERQIARWTRQYRATATHRIDAMERLMGWLAERVPAQSETTVVHGDYRLDNVVFHPTQPRIVAVLDWELATLGDPLADLAYHCMGWYLPLGTHRTLAGVDLAPLGIPGPQEYLAWYCRDRGLEPAEVGTHWNFHLAFNMFRLAAIQQGVARRALDGNAASSRAGDVADRVEQTAQAGWAQAKRTD
jgi:aminoglycoside phosphotransferase (APT) family kinase protein